MFKNNEGNIFGRPEHEKNCDCFVKQVAQLIPLYPDLKITAENQTRANIDKAQQVRDLPLPDKLKEEFLKRVRRRADLEDKLSAFVYVAEVDIWGWKTGLEKRMLEATRRTLAIADKLYPADIVVVKEFDRIPFNIHILVDFENINNK